MNDLPDPDGTHGIEIKTAPRQPLRRVLRVAKKTVARLDIEQLSALGVREGDPFFWLLVASVVLVGLAAWCAGCTPAAPAWPECDRSPGAYRYAVPGRDGWQEC